MGLSIGVRVPCYRRWCTAVEVRAIAQQAEDLGFDSLWVQDHLVAPVGAPEDTLVLGLADWMEVSDRPREPTTVQRYYAGDDRWLDPWVTWGFLAAATSRVRLASDIVVVPYRNPIVQAKMLGTLDVLSNGRMILGTGSGHVRAESLALGLDFDARARAHDEYLRIIIALLSAEEASFEGEFFRFGPVRTLIRPVQEPHPPIWIGGHGRRAIRRAAELGDGWLPSMVDPDGLARGIDELRVACERAGRPSLPTVAVSLPSRFRFAVAGAPAGRRPTTTPDEAISLLRRYADLGVEHVALGFAMPSLEVYLQQMSVFAAEVLPAFADPHRDLPT